MLDPKFSIKNRQRLEKGILKPLLVYYFKISVRNSKLTIQQ